jgi:hypothetical protein
MSANPVFFSNLKDAPVQLVNADGTTFKTLLVAGANGARIRSLMFTSDDTTSRTVQLTKNIGGTDFIIGEIVVPAGAGTNGTEPAVNGLNAVQMPWLQSDGANYFMDIANGTTLKIKSKVAVTAAKFINAVAEFGEP